MIIGHCADLHITGRPNETHATLDEQKEMLLWVGKHASDAGAKVMLVAGDIFDTASTPEERNVWVDVLGHWTAGYGLTVLGVRGNHDRSGELKIYNHMGGDVHFAEHPTTVPIGKLTVHCLPWPSKAMFAASTGLTSRTEIDAGAVAAMRAVIHGFRVESEKAHGPVIMMAHAELGSAITDSGQPMAGRCDIELSEGDLLDAGADYVALGHIHRHQILGDGEICYPGPPRPTTWGEPGGKGYCLIDVDRGEKPDITFVDVPHRAMETIDAEWVDGELRVSFAMDADQLSRLNDGGDIRLKYMIGESDQHAAAAAAMELKSRWLAGGVRAVKLAPTVVPTTRVRSEAIREARTTEDRVRAWWADKGSVPAREEQIIAKLGQLEAEVSA